MSEHVCCEHEHGGTSASSKRALIISIGLLAITFAAEVAGGLLSGSLALLADAGHVFMDLFALTISLVAATIAALPATSSKTYGWHRAEILAALVNGMLLAILALGLFGEAMARMSNPSEILAVPMFAVATVGLIVNIVIAFALHSSHDHDLNMKSAYLHVLGDMGASVGVVIGAVVMHFTGLYIVDVILTFIIGAVILVGALNLIMKAGHILLEGVPSHLTIDGVADVIREVEGVNNVHDLHVWTVCSHVVSMSCHINIDWNTPEDHDRIVRAVSDKLWKTCSIMHSTIQVDYTSCSGEIITQDISH